MSNSTRTLHLIACLAVAGAVLPAAERGLLGLGPDAAATEDVRFPPWAFAMIKGPDAAWDFAGMIDASKPPYNAVGDGRTDATAALTLAFKTLRNGTIYLPAGTYRISGTIDWQGWAMRNLHGAGRGRTILKLDDRAPGFGDPAKPCPVIRMAGSQDGGNSLGSTSFMNSVYFLTVDTGKGNPGAMGIEWMASNESTLRHVAVRSGDGSGVAGILYHGENSGLAYDVSVDGFATGLAADCAGYSNLIVDTLRLTGQTACGINISHEVFDARGVVYTGAGPLLTGTTGNSRFTFQDVEATGPADKAAFDLVGGVRGLVRNLRTTGFASAVAVDGKPTAKGGALPLWSTHPIDSVGGATAAPIGIPIEQSPEYHSNDFATWANVADFMAAANNDAATAVQAAIDSGAQTVFIPALKNSKCKIKSTIVMRGACRRIVAAKTFHGNSPRRDAKLFDGASIRVADGSAPDVTIERMGDGIAIEIATSRTVVVRDSVMTLYTATGAKGKVFIENTCSGGIRIGPGVRAWLRQPNPGADPAPGAYPQGSNLDPRARIVVDGGTMWLLGAYVEGDAADAKVLNGGALDSYGWLMQNGTPADGTPRFIVEKGRLFTAAYNRHMWNEGSTVFARGATDVPGGLFLRIDRTK